jgi:hypothetical protein
MMLLLTDENSSNGSRRRHPSQRRRGISNHRWSSLMIRRSPQPEEAFENRTTDTTFSTSPPRWSWIMGGIIERGATATTRAPPKQTLTLTPENGALPPMRTKIHHTSMALRWRNPNRLCRDLSRRRGMHTLHLIYFWSNLKKFVFD